MDDTQRRAERLQSLSLDIKQSRLVNRLDLPITPPARENSEVGSDTENQNIGDFSLTTESLDIPSLMNTAEINAAIQNGVITQDYLTNLCSTLSLTSPGCWNDVDLTSDTDYLRNERKPECNEEEERQNVLAALQKILTENNVAPADVLADLNALRESEYARSVFTSDELSDLFGPDQETSVTDERCVDSMTPKEELGLTTKTMSELNFSWNSSFRRSSMSSTSASSTNRTSAYTNRYLTDSASIQKNNMSRSSDEKQGSDVKHVVRWNSRLAETLRERHRDEEDEAYDGLDPELQLSRLERGVNLSDLFTMSGLMSTESFISELRDKYNIQQTFPASGLFVAWPGFKDEPASLVAIATNENSFVIAKVGHAVTTEMTYDLTTILPRVGVKLTTDDSKRCILLEHANGRQQLFEMCTSQYSDHSWSLFSYTIGSHESDKGYNVANDSVAFDQASNSPKIPPSSVKDPRRRSSFDELKKTSSTRQTMQQKTRRMRRSLSLNDVMIKTGSCRHAVGHQSNRQSAMSSRSCSTCAINSWAKFQSIVDINTDRLYDQMRNLPRDITSLDDPRWQRGMPWQLFNKNANSSNQDKIKEKNDGSAEFNMEAVQEEKKPGCLHCLYALYTMLKRFMNR